MVVPAVATDGTAGGISRDGRTLVLQNPRVGYPQRVSTLYFVDPIRLFVKRTLKLRGDFSFDAISPDGSTVYLIQLSAKDPRRYAVRALDARSGRLFAKPVVDPREPDEVMRGLPITRVTSPGGRFEYTLYSGDQHPFVHALDTVGRSAACIDLPLRNDSPQMHLRLGRGRLVVDDGSGQRAYVDLASYKARPAPTAAATPKHPDHGGRSLLPWALLAAGAALLLPAALLVRRRRSRLPA
jgi:hypothetical protein